MLKEGKLRMDKSDQRAFETFKKRLSLAPILAFSTSISFLKLNAMLVAPTLGQLSPKPNGFGLL